MLRRFPEQETRVESGPVQFGDDWPGVFIRGDNAMYYAMELGLVLDDLEGEIPAMRAHVLRGLRSDLASCESALHPPEPFDPSFQILILDGELLFDEGAIEAYVSLQKPPVTPQKTSVSPAARFLDEMNNLTRRFRTSDERYPRVYGSLADEAERAGYSRKDL